MAEKGVSGAAALLGVAGGFLIYVGIKDVPVIDGLRLLVRGKKPSEASRSGNDFKPFDWTDKNVGKVIDNIIGGALDFGGSRNPADMVQIPGTNIRVYKGIAQNVTALVTSARASGVNFDGSGYRDSQRQAELRRINGCPDLTSPSSTCRVPTAPVGKSQHEIGLAIDFTVNGQTLSSSSAGYRWLKAHAYKYGLKPLASEPWHWSTTGR